METSNIRIKKIWKWCGKEFEAQKASTQFCSKRCAEHAYKEKKRQEKKKQVETAEVERVTSGKEKKLQEYQYLSVVEAAQLLNRHVSAFINSSTEECLKPIEYRGNGQ